MYNRKQLSFHEKKLNYCQVEVHAKKSLLNIFISTGNWRNEFIFDHNNASDLKTQLFLRKQGILYIFSL